MELLNNKTKEELLDILYTQRLYITKINTELDTQEAQVQDIMDNVMPIIADIKSSNRFMKVIKLIKLGFTLFKYFMNWNENKKQTNGKD